MTSAAIFLSSSLIANCRISHNLAPLLSPPSLFPNSNRSSTKLNLSFSSSVLHSRTPLLPLPKSSESETAVLDSQPDAIQAVEVPSDPTPKREEVFAVVMIGSRQYIVIPGRYIYTQRLKGAKVNDNFVFQMMAPPKVIMNKVLLVGTKTSTYIGKPVVTNAAVHAVVEEQGLDKKVIVFKYKKKKNYRRNIGHRQPNSRIRITSVTGYQEYPAVTLDS